MPSVELDSLHDRPRGKNLVLSFVAAPTGYQGRVAAGRLTGRRRSLAAFVAAVDQALHVANHRPDTSTVPARYGASGHLAVRARAHADFLDRTAGHGGHYVTDELCGLVVVVCPRGQCPDE
jgi:hypothetical protein